MSLDCTAETNIIDSNTVSIKYIVGGWLTSIFCLFGIITNIFTVVVLLHPRMRNSSTHVYLMALSLCNIFLLVGLMINYSIKYIASYPELLAYLRQPDTINRIALSANRYEQFYAHVAPFTTPLLSMVLLCSTYLTVLVSSDRYFLICWPLLAEKIRTRKIALHVVLVVFILINLYILPHWFEYHTQIFTIQKLISTGNITSNYTEEGKLVEVTYTSFAANTIYLKIYRVYLNIPVTFVIPFTLLTVFNGSMIRQLLLIKRKKKRLGHRMKADIRITIMLIVIVLTFMLCRSINLLVNLLVQISPCLNKNSLHRFNTFANLLLAFNGFVNFFLFAAFGQRFREMVLYIFFRHGQFPFPTHLEAASIYRFTPINNIPTTDPLRRQSRAYSVTENDVWAAIARRRSSASMAALYNPLDIRQRTPSNTSYLNIPILSNVPVNSSKQLITVDNNNSLTIPNNNHYKNSNQTKTLDNGTPTSTAHVTFV